MTETPAARAARDTTALAARIRQHAVMMTSRGRSAHVGSILSMADIIAVLYGAVLQVDPSNPAWPDRDRFILSKGHAGAGVYAALAERGFFPVERLADHFANGSVFSGHVSHKGVPGVELSTGSLGHGLGVGTGMALAASRFGRAHRVVVLTSDGEWDEGSNWEALLFAAHHRLDQLTVVIDYNKLQSLASVEDTIRLEPFRTKLEAFGAFVSDVDGHDHVALLQTLRSAPAKEGQPHVVLAHTVKGKGVPFMEGQVAWHYRNAQGEQLTDAMAALGGGPRDA
jgi:transketolase